MQSLEQFDEETVRQTKPGVVPWSPPQPNWSAWQGCNIDEGPLATVRPKNYMFLRHFFEKMMSGHGFQFLNFSARNNFRVISEKFYFQSNHGSVCIRIPPPPTKKITKKCRMHVFGVYWVGCISRPAYPYDFGVLSTFFPPIVRLYAQQHCTTLFKNPHLKISSRSCSSKNDMNVTQQLSLAC